MLGSVLFFPWGKLDRQIDGSVRTHSLIDHMTDVAAVMHRLLHLPALETKLDALTARILQNIVGSKEV